MIFNKIIFLLIIFGGIILSHLLRRCTYKIALLEKRIIEIENKLKLHKLESYQGGENA